MIYIGMRTCRYVSGDAIYFFILIQFFLYLQFLEKMNGLWKNSLMIEFKTRHKENVLNCKTKSTKHSSGGL